MRTRRFIATSRQPMAMGLLLSLGDLTVVTLATLGAALDRRPLPRGRVAVAGFSRSLCDPVFLEFLLLVVA